jgi:hypothetical protein
VTSTLKRYVPTIALLIGLCFFLSAGWLAVPAIILIIQVVTDRPGRLLLAITGRSGRLRH